jgi:hypothetical protein
MRAVAEKYAFKLIYGLYDLDEGSIVWNETEVLGPKYNLAPGMSFAKYLSGL